MSKKLKISKEKSGCAERHKYLGYCEIQNQRSIPSFKNSKFEPNIIYGIAEKIEFSKLFNLLNNFFISGKNLVSKSAVEIQEADEDRTWWTCSTKYANLWRATIARWGRITATWRISDDAVSLAHTNVTRPNVTWPWKWGSCVRPPYDTTNKSQPA